MDGHHRWPTVAGRWRAWPIGLALTASALMLTPNVGTARPAHSPASVLGARLKLDTTRPTSEDPGVPRSTPSAESVPTPVFTQLDMISTSTGFAFGHIKNRFFLWKTTDGGKHWHRYDVPQVPSPFGIDLSPIISFQTAQRGWIASINEKPLPPGHSIYQYAGTLIVLRTTTGGQTWSAYRRKVTPMDQVEQIDFVGKDGWIRAVSAGASNQADTAIYHSGNRGKSWSLVSSASGYIPNPQSTLDALPTADVPMPMTFTNSRDGWVGVGNVIMHTSQTIATLYHTTTAGRQWLPLFLPIPKILQKGYMTTESPPVFSDGIGTVLVWYIGDGHRVVVAYHTMNSGKSWTAEPPWILNADATLQPAFVGPNRGWLIGSVDVPNRLPTLYAATTNNGGRSWSQYPIQGALQAVLDGGYTLISLDMMSSAQGWMLLDRLNTKGSVLLRTRDGGHTWHVQRW